MQIVAQKSAFSQAGHDANVWACRWKSSSVNCRWKLLSSLVFDLYCCMFCSRRWSKFLIPWMGREYDEFKWKLLRVLFVEPCRNTRIFSVRKMCILLVGIQGLIYMTRFLFVARNAYLWLAALRSYGQEFNLTYIWREIKDVRFRCRVISVPYCIPHRKQTDRFGSN